jgi:hypothetical protein
MANLRWLKSLGDISSSEIWSPTPANLSKGEWYSVFPVMYVKRLTMEILRHKTCNPDKYFNTSA